MNLMSIDRELFYKQFTILFHSEIKKFLTKEKEKKRKEKRHFTQIERNNPLWAHEFGYQLIKKYFVHNLEFVSFVCLYVNRHACVCVYAFV